MYTNENGEEQQLTLDDTFTPTLGLLHEDYIERAIPLPNPSGSVIDVHLVSPLDLALSKLVRFAEHDQDDIVALAKAKLITAEELLQHAEEALQGHIGNIDMLRINIRQAVESISQ